MKAVFKTLGIGYLVIGILYSAWGFMRRNGWGVVTGVNVESTARGNVGEVLAWPVFIFKPEWIDKQYRTERGL